MPFVAGQEAGRAKALSSGMCAQARGSWAYMAPGTAPAAASLPHPTGLLEHLAISQTHMFTAQAHW